MADGRNALETFGRALQGFGYGVQGRTPPFVEEDLARERMGLERERMAQGAGQFERTLQMQKEQFERQDAQTRATIFRMGMEALPKGQEFLSAIPDESKRRVAAKQLAQWASQAFQFGSRKADPTLGELATPEFLEEMFLGGPEALTLVDDIEFTLPEQRRAVAPLLKQGKEGIKAARETLQSISRSQQDQILGGVYERIRALPPVEGGYDPETAFRLANVSRMERRAIDLLPNRFDAARLDQFYQQAGLIPPSRTAKVGEAKALIPTKAAEAEAIQLKKEATPGGQAAIGLQRAQTAAAETPTIIPLQQGAGFAEMPKGKGAVPRIVEPPTPKPVQLSPAERTTLIEEQGSLERFDKMATLYRSDFVGPVRGRVGAAGETTGAISPAEAEFRSQVAEFHNAMLRQISGAAVTPAEARRLQNQLPTVNDPPTVFEAKLRQTRRNLYRLAQIRRETLSKTGADLSKLQPLPPPPDDPLGIR